MNLNNYLLAGLIILGLLISITEMYMVGYLFNNTFIHTVYFGTVVSVIAIHLFCIRNPELLKRSIITKIGLSLSMLIYIMHIYYGRVINKIWQFIFEESLILDYIFPLIVIITSIIGSYVFYVILKKFCNKTGLNWVK